MSFNCSPCFLPYSYNTSLYCSHSDSSNTHAGSHASLSRLLIRPLICESSIPAYDLPRLRAQSPERAHSLPGPLQGCSHSNQRRPQSPPPLGSLFLLTRRSFLTVTQTHSAFLLWFTHTQILCLKVFAAPKRSTISAASWMVFFLTSFRALLSCHLTERLLLTTWPKPEPPAMLLSILILCFILIHCPNYYLMFYIFNFNLLTPQPLLHTVRSLRRLRFWFFYCYIPST